MGRMISKVKQGEEKTSYKNMFCKGTLYISVKGKVFIAKKHIKIITS